MERISDRVKFDVDSAVLIDESDDEGIYVQWDSLWIGFPAVMSLLAPLSSVVTWRSDQLSVKALVGSWCTLL